MNGFFIRIIFTVTGHHKDINVVILFDFMSELKAIHAGKHNIGNDNLDIS